MNKHGINSTLLTNSIEELSEKIKTARAVNVDDISEAAIKSAELLTQIMNITLYIKNQEIKSFLDELLQITQELHRATIQNTREDTPPSLMKKLVSNFESFINNVISQEERKSIRVMLSHVPAIDNIIYCCETMPYYWEHAEPIHKFGMVLGATLMVAAVALTIATNVAPALAGVALIPPAILCLIHLGRRLYNQIIAQPKIKYDNTQKLGELEHKLEEQEQFILRQINNLNKHLQSTKTTQELSLENKRDNPIENKTLPEQSQHKPRNSKNKKSIDNKELREYKKEVKLSHKQLHHKHHKTKSKKNLENPSSEASIEKPLISKFYIKSPSKTNKR